jgi:hypothetical protein
MRTIIAGSRDTITRKDLSDALRACGWASKITVVLSGKCRGVDAWGESFAYASGLPVEEYPADWDGHGRGAGHIRNAAMVRKSEALLAVWDGKSPGTEDVIKRARKAGLQVYVHIPERYRETSPLLDLLGC